MKKTIFDNKNFASRRGQSLMELLVGMAVGAVLIIGSAAIITSSLQSNGTVTGIQFQAQLGEELLNNTKAWAEGNWNSLLALATGTANQYYLNTTLSPFTILSVSSTSSVYANGYAYSRSITVNASQVSSTQTNFPMLFSGTYSYLAASSSGGLVQNPNGDDIIFTSDAGGTTKLNWEVESYTSSTGNIVAWVNIPTLTSSTVIYIFYNNPSVNTFQGGSTGSAWNSNYVGVWHLSEGAGTTAYDSTANGNNGTWNGSGGGSVSTYYSSGKIGNYSGYFNGSNNFVNLGDPSVLPNGAAARSMCVWGYLNSLPGGWSWASSYGSPSAAAAMYLGANGSTVDGGAYGSDLQVGSYWSVGAWNYICLTYNGSIATLYGNGSQIASGSFSWSLAQEYAYIGKQVNGGEYWPGLVSELSIFKIALSSSWILTEYNNQNSPSTFYTIGTQQAVGGSSSYAYSRSITVNASQVSSTQTNFPMLFSGTYSYLAASSSGGLVQNPNGDDIIFTSDAGGTTKLNWEVESYTSSTGNIVAWVNIPTLTSSTVIYIFYNNPSVNTFQGGSTGSAWNSNYVGVWHLGSNGTLSAYDSTANGNNGTIEGGVTAVSSFLGVAGNFDGSTGYINLPAPLSTTLFNGGNAFTISGWINQSVLKQDEGLLGVCSVQNTNQCLHAVIRTGEPYLGFYGDDLSGGSTAINTWYYYTATYVGSSTNQTALYLNGTLTGTGIASGVLNAAGATPQIGTSYAFTSNLMQGELDEVRFSNIVRSPSWIITEYNNQSAPSSFYTIGTQQTNYSAATPSIESIINNGLTYQRSFYLSDVYRDSNGFVTSTISGNFYDPSTKLVTVSISVVSSTIPTATYSMYITRNNSNELDQKLWTGGGGFIAPSTFVSSTFAQATNTMVLSQGGFQTSLPNIQYAYSRSITVNASQVSSTQTNFPMLFSGTYSYLAASSSGGLVQNPNGDDIIFTSDAGGTTKLNWEVESYTSSTGNIVAWVNIPTLTSSTVIYIFYNNPSVNTFQGGSTGSAWNSNYAAVYHFSNGITLSTNDSTAHGNNGVVDGAPSSTTGEIGGAASFNGTSDYIYSNVPSSTSNLTFSAWLYSKMPTSTIPLYIGNSGANGYGFIVSNGSCGAGSYLQILAGGSSCDVAASTYTIATNAWTYAVGTYDGTAWRIYANGVQVASNARGGANTPNGETTIGAASYGGGFYQGYIDEVRLMTVALTPSWILTEYNNQSAPNSFYTVAGLGGGIVTSTIDSEPFDTGSAAGTELNSFIWQGTQPVGATAKFQFAVSNSSSGPWNFVGPDGTGNTYFTGSVGTPISLISPTNGYTLFSGYRYFAYRTTLSTTGASSTIVNEVSINWSP